MIARQPHVLSFCSVPAFGLLMIEPNHTLVEVQMLFVEDNAASGEKLTVVLDYTCYSWLLSNSSQRKDLIIQKSIKSIKKQSNVFHLRLFLTKPP